MTKLKELAVIILCLSATLFLGIGSRVALQAGAKATASLTGLDLAVGEARATLATANATLSQQQGYYRDSASHVKALTRAAALDAVALGRLIEHLDEDRGRIAGRADLLLANADHQVQRVGASAQIAILDAVPVLDGLKANTEALNRLLEDSRQAVASPEIQDTLKALATSSRNVEVITEKGIEVGANLSDATKSVRELLSPKKSSFWWRVIQLLIPKPTIRL